MSFVRTEPMPSESLGNVSPCGLHCDRQVGPAAALTYALDPDQQLVDRNALDPDWGQPLPATALFSPHPPRVMSPSGFSDEKVRLETPYLRSGRYHQYLDSPDNYNWTQEKALFEQLQTIQAVFLNSRNYHLYSAWVDSDGGRAKRLIYRLRDPQGQDLTTGDVPEHLVSFLQDYIYKVVHESPYDRVLLSTANPPKYVTSGQLTLIINQLTNLPQQDGFRYRLFVHKIEVSPDDNYPPVYELRANYPHDPEHQDEALNLLRITQAEILDYVEDWMTYGYSSLQLWNVNYKTKLEWVNRWGLQYDASSHLIWPNEDHWQALTPMELAAEQVLDGWHQPVWNRMQLLHDLMPGYKSNYHWQYWPVRNNWWQTVAAMYQVWPSQWARPYITGRGMNLVIWGWPLSSVNSSNITELSEVFNALVTSVNHSNDWSGVHPIFSQKSIEIPDHSKHQIITIPLQDDLIYNYVYVVRLQRGDPPLQGYNALVEPDSVVDLLQYYIDHAPIVDQVQSLRTNLGELPSFISAQVQGLHLANLRKWIHNILQMLGQPQGTFTISSIGQAFEIDLFNEQGGKITREQCLPLPFDISSWSQYQLLTNDPRWLLSPQLPDETLRWGPGFIGPRERANPDSQDGWILPAVFEDYTYVEKDPLIPGHSYLWTNYWQLNDLEQVSIAGFNFWNYQTDHVLGEHLYRLQQGQLLVWEISMWIWNWVQSLTGLLQFKYVLENAGLLEQGLKLDLDGSLRIEAANKAEAMQLLSKAYQCLAQTNFQQLRVSNDKPKLAALKIAKQIKWQLHSWWVSFSAKQDQFEFDPVTKIIAPDKPQLQDRLIHLQANFDPDRIEVHLWLVLPGLGRVEFYRGPGPNLEQNWLTDLQSTIQGKILNLPLVYRNLEQLPVLSLTSRTIANLLRPKWPTKVV